MSLNHGRPLVAIPGPSIIPDRVLAAMHRPSPNIYEGALVEMVDTIIPDLCKVAKTKHKVAIYIANGHGAWEAALKNTLLPGDKVLVIGTGKFPVTWGQMANSHGIETEIMDFGMQSAANSDMLLQCLNDDKENKIKAVLAVQTDTASSVKNDIPALRKAINDANHDALFMVDCIACLGCDEFHMDDWGVDVTIAACQKGLMTPAGMGFVYFNDKALEAGNRAKPGEYWDWKLRTQSDLFYRKFDGTAPTHNLYGLREALDMIVHEEGIEAVWKRHATFAGAVWAAIEGWGEAGSLKLNIKDAANRSNAVTTVKTKQGEATRIREWCETHAGVTLGIGLGFEGEEYDNHLRIGHMGHLNPPMLLGALGTIETAMKALSIPHAESGLSRACQVLAQH